MAKEKGMYKALVGAGESTKAERKGEKEAVAGRARVDTEEEASARESSAVEGDAAAATETQSCSSMCAALFKKKEVKEKAYAVPKNRIWEYSRPEWKFVAVGSVASIIKGTIFPLLSIVFTKMIVCWYLPNTDQIRSDSLMWSFMFYGLAFASLLTETVQKGLFELVGERLTRRLRSDLFRGIIRQNIEWFEEDENNQGALGKLSTFVMTCKYNCNITCRAHKTPRHRLYYCYYSSSSSSPSSSYFQSCQRLDCRPTSNSFGW